MASTVNGLAPTAAGQNGAPLQAHRGGVLVQGLPFTLPFRFSTSSTTWLTFSIRSW